MIGTLRVCLSAVVAFVVSGVGGVQATEFELVKGGRYELCRTFHENLKLFPDLPQTVTEVPLDPRFEDFRPIHWEDLDPLAHERIIREIVIREADWRASRTWPGMSAEEQEAAWQDRKDDIVGRAQDDRIGFGRARFDINHDGEAETVYRFGYHQWPARYPEPHMTYAWQYHVMPWDQEKASRQLRRYSTQGFDAFLHKGRVYMTTLGSLRGIVVIEPRDVEIVGSLNLRYVCEFQQKAK